MTALIESPVVMPEPPAPPPASKPSLLDRLNARLVADWRTLLSFASIKVHLVAVSIGALYETMPVLDPAVAASLPAPLAAKAISLYAIGGIIVRAVKFKQQNPPASNG